MAIEVISFDADGTLVDTNFTDTVWFEGIPKLYAERWGVPFEKSLKIVKREYERIGPERIEWYDLDYWIKKFSLSGKTKLLEGYSDRARLYPEVRSVTKKLFKEYNIVIASASSKVFLDLEMRKTGIRKYFTRVFSSISDFGTIGKSTDFFRHVCEEMKIQPSELLHVGDRRDHDFTIPRKLGIRAVLLDREGKMSGKWVIHDLKGIYKFL